MPTIIAIYVFTYIAHFSISFCNEEEGGFSYGTGDY